MPILIIFQLIFPPSSLSMSSSDATMHIKIRILINHMEYTLDLIRHKKLRYRS